jgi:predicted RND superfamily exporter protein
VTRFVQLILSHRVLVGAALLLSLALALYAARTIRVSFQFRDFYDYPDNPHAAAFKKDYEQFGDPAGYVVVLVEAEDVFRKDVLEYVHRITAALEPEKTFVKVHSLTNARAVRGRGDEVVSGPLLWPVPEAPEALQEARQFALQSSLLRRRLVSSDGRTSAVLAEMRTPSTFSTVNEQRVAIETVRAALARTPPPTGITVRLTGAPPLEVGITDSLIRDQLVLLPAVLGMLSLVVFAMFRSLHAVFLCLAAVSVATIWTAGLFALLGRSVDMIGSVIPTTILAYGVVDPIFVLARVLNKLDAGRAKQAAILEAFSELGLPCFLSSLTTALGFAAFVTASQPTIRYYGATVAVGVLLAWVTTITVVPLLISLLRLPERRFNAIESTRFIDRRLQSLWTFLRVRVGKAVLVSLMLLLGGAWWAREQHIDNVYVDQLPDGRARDDVRHLEQQLGGVLSLTVHLRGARDVMKQPGVLAAVQAIDSAMEKHPLVTLSTSLSDLVAEANQAFQGGNREERVVPRSRALIAQYLALVDPSDRSAFVTDDYAQSRIALLLVDQGSEKTRAVTRDLRRAVEAAAFPELGVSALITGSGVVGYGELDKVVLELLEGFVVAFLLVVLLQGLALRSARLALISVVPNLIPVVACFLVLRALGTHLRIDTALVLCISIGGLFNTTIHFSARVRQLVAAGEREPDSIVERAMRSIGPPALFTAAALSAGLAVLLLSSFPGLRALGLLSVITLCVGFLSDMTITPVLLRAGYDWRAARSGGGPAQPTTEPALASVNTALE